MQPNQSPHSPGNQPTSKTLVPLSRLPEKLAQEVLPQELKDQVRALGSNNLGAARYAVACHLAQCDPRLSIELDKYQAFQQLFTLDTRTGLNVLGSMAEAYQRASRKALVAKIGEQAEMTISTFENPEIGNALNQKSAAKLAKEWFEYAKPMLIRLGVSPRELLTPGDDRLQRRLQAGIDSLNLDDIIISDDGNYDKILSAELAKRYGGLQRLYSAIAQNIRVQEQELFKLRPALDAKQSSYLSMLDEHVKRC